MSRKLELITSSRKTILGIACATEFQLINLPQEIPFTGTAGYIAPREIHTRHSNTVVLVRKDSDHARHNHRLQRQVFEIEPELAAVIAHDNEIKITIVPIDSHSRKPKTMKFNYGEISIQPLK